MGFWDRMRAWFSPPPAAAAGFFPGPFSEPDEHLYRKLTDRGLNDLPGYQHDKMLEIAAHLDRANPIARRILSLITEFVFAEGVQVQARSQPVQEVIDRHWHDWVNDWPANGPALFRLALRDGEVILPAAVNPVDGFVRWGQIMSRSVKEISTHPNDWRIVRSVTLTTPPGQPDDIRPGIVLDPMSGHLVPAEVEGADMDNPVLMLRYGNVDGLRGVSFLYALADFLEYLDRSLFSEIERLDLLRSFIWDVRVEGATEEALREMLRQPEFQTPAPGHVRAHNEKITWQAVTPDLGTHESVELIRFLLKTLVLGATGIPEHWFGSGGEVNRAVGTVMNEPTVKMLSSLQRWWGHYLNIIIRFVLDQAILMGTLPEQVPVEDSEGKPTGKMADPRDLYEIVFPDMDTADIGQTATALKDVTEALATAEDRQWVTRRTGRRVFAAVVSQLGPDVDGDEEGRMLADEEPASDETAAGEVVTIAAD